jgi:hypothetical protein
LFQEKQKLYLSALLVKAGEIKLRNEISEKYKCAKAIHI